MLVDLKAWAEDVEDQFKEIQDDLAPLEARKMTIGEREGNGPCGCRNRRLYLTTCEIDPFHAAGTSGAMDLNRPKCPQAIVSGGSCRTLECLHQG